MKKKKVPEIRFKGFDDDWEQCKLGDMLTVLKDGTHGTHADVDNGVYLLSAKNIKNGCINIDDSDRQISFEEYERIYSNFKLKSGDVLMTIVGTIGDAAILETPENVIFQRSVAFLRPNENLSNVFLLQTISTKDFQKQLDSRKSISAQPGIYLGEIAQIRISISMKMAEQEKIGTCFFNLDRLITFHRRKYEKLKLFKDAMLNKMFPKNGEKIPEIRFKGFANNWEEHKFSDITFLTGEKNKDNLPYESYSISYEKGFVPQNEQFENGGTMKDADKRMYYIVKPNSFAYNPARINIGSIGYSNLSKKVIVSSLYEVFQTVEDVDDRFLWHWFKTNTFQKMIEQLQEGGVRLYFYYDKLCMGTIMMPVLSEQKKIGEYLDNLDNLITLHQRKYEKLKLFKEAMLNKMFI